MPQYQDAGTNELRRGSVISSLNSKFKIPKYFAKFTFLLKLVSIFKVFILIFPFVTILIMFLSLLSAASIVCVVSLSYLKL